MSWTVHGFSTIRRYERKKYKKIQYLLRLAKMLSPSSFEIDLLEACLQSDFTHPFMNKRDFKISQKTIFNPWVHVVHSIASFPCQPLFGIYLQGLRYGAKKSNHNVPTILKKSNADDYENGCRHLRPRLFEAS